MSGQEQGEAQDASQVGSVDGFQLARSRRGVAAGLRDSQAKISARSLHQRVLSRPGGGIGGLRSSPRRRHDLFAAALMAQRHRDVTEGAAVFT